MIINNIIICMQNVVVISTICYIILVYNNCV